MSRIIKTKWIILGIVLISLAAVLACGEEATPTPTPAASPVLDTAALSSLVQQAVEQAVGSTEAGLSAEEIRALVQDAVEQAAAPGATAEEIQAMVSAAVQASAQAGVSREDIGSVVQGAVQQAIAALPTPVAAPTPTVRPAGFVEPSGTLNVGIAGSIPSGFVLNLQSYLQGKMDSVLTNEAMFVITLDGNVQPLLVKNWSVDASGLEYTFNLQDGVKWHQQYGDWGTFDADDFLFSIESVGLPGSSHGFAGSVRRFFQCEGCELSKVDDLTVRLRRPSPSAEVIYFSNTPNGVAFHSKEHFDAVGEDAALHQSVGTGPWELVELKSDQFRRLNAVRDHWRKTPEFDELLWWDISEESTRVANFITGLIDTGQFTLTAIQEIKAVANPEVKFMTFPNRIGKWVNLYGGQYNTDYVSHQPSADGPARVPLGDNVYDCSLPWVSCDRNTGSAEWAKARNVRLAMNMSINRQQIVNNLAYGNGSPDYLLNWGGYEDRARQFGLDQLEYDFDPARARQLLAEAGYAGGFDVEMLLYPGFPAGGSELGEAVCTMWLEINIRCEQTTIPYFTHRPSLVNRTAKGVAGYSGPTPAPEPLLQTGLYYSSWGSFNFGWEHPAFEDLALEAASLLDEDARWAKMAEMNKWIFDEVMGIPVIAEDIIWPVGARIDTWTPLGAYLDWLSNWEFTPHRKS